jgi:hypothetical protein
MPMSECWASASSPFAIGDWACPFAAPAEAKAGRGALEARHQPMAARARQVTAAGAAVSGADANSAFASQTLGRAGDVG